MRNNKAVEDKSTNGTTYSAFIIGYLSPLSICIHPKLLTQLAEIHRKQRIPTYFITEDKQKKNLEKI
jgi:hypothetical protein